MTTWFGNTSYSTVNTLSSGWPFGSLAVAPVSGNITTARGYLLLYGSGSFRVLVYADSGGNPGALVATSDAQTLSGGMALRTFTFSTPGAVTSGSSYWLMFYGNDFVDVRVAATGLFVYRYDVTYPAVPNPFGTVSGSTAQNIYLEAGIDPASTTYSGSATVSLTDTITAAGKRTTFAATSVTATATVTTTGLVTEPTLFAVASLNETVTITTRCELPPFDLEPRPIGSLVLNPADPDAFTLTPHTELVR